MCEQPITADYLREMGTHRVDCNHDCYTDHCNSAFLLLEGPVGGSFAGAAQKHASPTSSADRSTNAGVKEVSAAEGRTMR